MPPRIIKGTWPFIEMVTERNAIREKGGRRARGRRVRQGESENEERVICGAQA